MRHGEASQYVKKNSPIIKKGHSYKIDNLYFTLTKIFLQNTEQGDSFIFRLVALNKGQSTRKVRLVEQVGKSYMLYGEGFKTAAVRDKKSGACVDCFNYLALQAGQSSTFFLGTAPRPVRTNIDIPLHLIRLRFEVKEEGFFNYPVDIEYKDLVFTKKGWESIYDERKKPDPKDKKQQASQK